MKKLFLLLTLIAVVMFSNITTPVFADVMPYYVSTVNPEAIGVYQAPKNITIYAQPNENAKKVLEAKWDYKNFNCANSSASNLFLVFVAQKELAFLTVVDANEDWAEVIYDRSTNKRGWIKKEPLRFMMWRNFYNTYGNKYGLYLLKDAPDEVKNLHSSTSNNSQTVNVILVPQKIKLVVVKGNWALVTVSDIDKTQKTGYLQWRDINGKIYAFPAIK